METWKDVVGWEGLYEVSDMGNVRNTRTGRILRQSPRPKGYVAVTFYRGSKESRKSYLVHRVVAEAFIGTYDLQVNHRDCNTSNNELTNLEYCTNMENMQHAIQNGRYRKSVNNNKKAILQINPITGEIVKHWKSILDAKMSGFNPDRVLYGKGKTSNGYYWRYANA